MPLGALVAFALVRRGAVFAITSVAALSLLCASCTSAPKKGSSKPETVGTEAPLPAGKNPSVISKMVCGQESQEKIARVLGVDAHVPTPTWVDDVYSCRFVYPNGSFVLSVKELSNWSQTFAYFHGLQATLGDTGALGNLGQGAFTTKNGSVVVRKDWKVLDVAISGLPAQFGRPPTNAADVAYTVADLILGCWDGD